MDMKQAEEIAEDPGSAEDSLRREAYAWLESKRFNKSLSEDFRKRADTACIKIFNWAYARATKMHPVTTKTKRHKSI